MIKSGLRICWDALDALKKKNSIENMLALVAAVQKHRPDFDTFLTDPEAAVLRQATKAYDSGVAER